MVECQIAFQRSWTVTGLLFSDTEEYETILSLLVKHDRHHFVERLELGISMDVSNFSELIHKLSELRSLSFCKVGFPSDVFPALSSMSNLEELSLSLCDVAGNFGHMAKYNPRLIKLHVIDGGNAGKWSNSSSISSLVNLKELVLQIHCHRDTDLNLSHLQKLTELTNIEVNIFADGSIESLTNLKKLSKLSLVCYSGGMVGDIACLKNFSKLTTLSLRYDYDYNNDSPQIHGNMGVLSHLVHLRMLVLEHCYDIRGEIDHILHCRRLERLKLNYLPHLRGDVRELNNLTNLTHCYLGGGLESVSGDIKEFERKYTRYYY
jgi:hypothetical protein